MRRILLATFIGASFCASAQNLEIRDLSGNVLNNTVQTHNGNATDFEIISENFRVYNIGSSTVSVKCKRTELSCVATTETALCWTVCSMYYAAGVYPVLTAPSSAQNIAAGDFRDLYKLHYKPMGNAGVSSYRVTFFNTADANDTASFTIVFDAALSVTDYTPQATAINAYPNPANNFINIDVANFSDKATVRITDALGVTVKTAQINGEANLKFSTADLRAGVYFYSLITNNKAILTRRLVITH